MVNVVKLNVSNNPFIMGVINLNVVMLSVMVPKYSLICDAYRLCNATPLHLNLVLFSIVMEWVDESMLRAKLSSLSKSKWAHFHKSISGK